MKNTGHVQILIVMIESMDIWSHNPLVTGLGRVLGNTLQCLALEYNPRSKCIFSYSFIVIIRELFQLIKCMLKALDKNFLKMFWVFCMLLNNY